MSEQGEKPEVLPGDLITRPGLYKARCGEIVPITGWEDGWWITEWDGLRSWYASNGRERFYEGPDADRWQLLHWVGPLPASEPETETTTEQLAEIEGQGEFTPATEYTPPEGWRVLAVGEVLREGDVTVRADGYQYPTERVGSVVGANQRYIRPIESQPQPQPIQVREGRWKTRHGAVKNIRPCEPLRGAYFVWPWTDGIMTFQDNGRHLAAVSDNDLVEYLGPIEKQPEPLPEPDAELRIRLLKQANDSQAETIGRLLTEARDLNMEIGGLERQLLQRDARIRDLETMHAAAAQAVVDAGKQNDALRLQVQNRQQEYERQKGRIEFLETLDAGNAVAIVDYRAQVAKLQGLVDFARKQLEDAANEISQQRSYLDKYDKQLDQKDAQIRDLRIELEAAQQVQQPVGDEERERIWDEATEQAGRQVVRWLRPLTLALNRQPDERFSRFMALTLSVLPDLLPELLGYAVENEADGDCEE